MSKITPFFIAFAAACTVGSAHAKTNPFMGDAQNQVAFYVSQGVNGGFLVPPPTQWVPFSFFHAQYSQPATFFRMQARQSLNVGQTVGMGKAYGWNWTKFTIPLVYLSEDVALLHGRRWYTSAGAGMGLQAQQNERLGAKLLFQFKIAAGWRMTDHFTGEVFVQHFSNANTADQNNSYGFYGLGLAYSF